MRFLKLLLLFFAGACFELDPRSSADDGGAASGDQPPTGNDASVGVVSGVGCATDSASGITLCTSAAPCASLTVDREAFPNCGFRVPAAALELACICGDWICPMARAEDCKQAATLLAEASELAACSQAADGRCVPRPSSKPSPTGGCDPGCAADCSGVPGCLALCGC